MDAKKSHKALKGEESSIEALTEEVAKASTTALPEAFGGFARTNEESDEEVVGT